MNNKLKYSPTNLRSNASFGSERRSWIIEIHSFLEQQEEEQEEPEVPVCIFNAPKLLRTSKPDAYTPQLLALGPYHHFYDHLHDMERYKLVVTKRAQVKFPNLKFQDLTHHIMKYESRIRACYHKYLEIDSETLAIMLILDGLFLLDFLHVYIDISYSILATSTKMSHLVNKSGKRFSYDCILRDIFMLENQIPLLVLKKILYMEMSSSSNLSDQQLHEASLPRMLLGICKEVSPFQISDDLAPPAILQLSSYAHLLDVLYHLIVPKIEQSQDDCIEAEDSKEATEARVKIKLDPNEETAEEIFQGVWNAISKCNVRVVSKICKPLNFLVKLPWKFLRNLPGLSIILSAITNLIFPNEKGSSKPDDGGSTKDRKIEQNSLANEIMVPSVTSLHEAGVEFCITPGDITSIVFDTKTKILYLPIKRLDVNSEVILRNLIAYEATAIQGPLVLARYVEFMNGIIDTAFDAKLLREKMILKNELKSDKEAADLWNGMSRSIRLSKVTYLEKAIEDINEYYHSTWKVKTHKYLKRFLHGSWEFLVLMATLLFLCLMVLQSFCSIYSCPRFFHISDSDS